MIAVWREEPDFKIYPSSEVNWSYMGSDWDCRVIVPTGEHYSLFVPEGFITDGPSIPLFAQILVPVNGFNRMAGLPHDAFYAIKGDGFLTRAQVDRLFYTMARPGWRSRAAYASLVLFGGKAWDDTSEVDKLNIAQGTLPTVKIV